MAFRQIAAVFLGLSVGCAALSGCEGAGIGPNEVRPDSSAPPDEGEPAISLPATRLFVLDTLAFAPEIEGATDQSTMVDGFNLDGVVSDGPAIACGEADYMSPDGTPGIDSKVSRLLPLFAIVGIGAAEGLLQSTIEEGGILLMLQVGGIDDPVNDDDVEVTIRAGFGKPLLATDGRLLPGQTFHLRPDSLDSVAESGRIEDGVVTAGPVDTTLRLRVLGQDYELPVHGAWLRGRLTEDGGLDSGVLGAAVAIADLQTIGAIAANDDAGVLKSINSLFAGAGDLAPDEDGVCQQISATLAYSAVSAYLFGASAP
jgi:hypothetical protein